jgi:hypothetical protein
MKFELFSQVYLREDIPEYHLKKGNIATLVDYHSSINGGEDCYSLEGFILPEDCPDFFIILPASKIEQIDNLIKREPIKNNE